MAVKWHIPIMKKNILIPLGFLILIIAIANSLLDFGSFPNIRGNNFPVISSSADNVYQTSGSFENTGNGNKEFFKPTETPDKFSDPMPSIDSQDLQNSEGFLPVKVEKNQSGNEFVENLENKTIPIRIIINDIKLDAPVVKAENKEIVQDGVTYNQWSAPNEFAAGWHGDSAYLGSIGNTVINGHHNVYGEVFKDLHLLVEGEKIDLIGDDGIRYTYIVTNVMILPERDVSIDQRLDNAKWIMPSIDERLTLITCWPSYSNTHRLIIVAKPESSVIFSQMPEQ